MTKQVLVRTVVASFIAFAASLASAAPIPITAAVFGAGSTLTTFDGVAPGTEVDGLLVDGILFDYSLGPGHLEILDDSSGPGTTNNIADETILVSGSNTGDLRLFLPSFTNQFGYGFAINAFDVTVPAATSVGIFSGATFLGFLNYTGVPDPDFAGGFAGIQNDVPFDRVVLRFNTSASAFALDNIRVGPSAVPEPTSLVLLGTGVGGLLLKARRRKKS